jgi:hypothetical protein
MRAKLFPTIPDAEFAERMSVRRGPPPGDRGGRCQGSYLTV